jgi:hypothetical protein
MLGRGRIKPGHPKDGLGYSHSYRGHARDNTWELEPPLALVLATVPWDTSSPEVQSCGLLWRPALRSGDALAGG